MGNLSFMHVVCVGVTIEYVKFGRAEGGLNDVKQLDSLLRALKVTVLTLYLDMLLSLQQRSFLASGIMHEQQLKCMNR